MHGGIYEELAFENIAHRLRYSNESITSIASRFSYSDADHFPRSFKRIFQLTPSDYRKNLTVNVNTWCSNICHQMAVD